MAVLSNEHPPSAHHCGHLPVDGCLAESDDAAESSPTRQQSSAHSELLSQGEECVNIEHIHNIQQ